MKRTLIFDTETTGLIDNSVLPIKHQPQIIEFFGHIIDPEGNVIEELEFFCDPGKKLEPIITRITGIKSEDLVGHPPFSEFAPAVCALIGRSDSVVAHNLSYDWALVNMEMERCGMKAEWPLTRICTVEETEWYKGHRLSLSALHEHLFGEVFEGAHRARQDVEALTRCFVELRKRGDV